MKSISDSDFSLLRTLLPRVLSMTRTSADLSDPNDANAVRRLERLCTKWSRNLDRKPNHSQLNKQKDNDKE